ncbi:hypothetical protein I5M27_12185 [Adhaeribacter sp. BT258]|uniref:MetA-pathway of phenol degradation n=1 Tax=Adhaeribacter terrigena TaxID=2793070 RepID=A0ABS1C2X2_9BACT|nr:hypothetical protein [Adhaeribacter terrigena]MBK0403750.1 hypothetical protein [Adhaeribacter terrigena]
MLKKIIMAGFCGLLFTSAQNAQGCDACGCGVGSYQFGILPQQNKNFVGLRYQQKSDETAPKHGSQSKESFQSTEIWGRFYPLKKVQVLALLPYNFNQQKTESGTTQVQGLGDALVLVNYNLLNNTDSLYQKVKHNLFVGGGVKLPTGEFDSKIEGSEMNPNMQLGSGSFDLVANAMYTVRYDKIGLNTNVTYKYNTVNKNEFMFGNKFGAGTVLFSVLKVKEMAIMPNAGFSTEITAKDQHFGSELLESGGHANFVSAGSEFYFKNLSAGATLQKPVSQNVSEGYVKTGNRLLTHLTFMF